MFNYEINAAFPNNTDTRLMNSTFFYPAVNLIQPDKPSADTVALVLYGIILPFTVSYRHLSDEH